MVHPDCKLPKIMLKDRVEGHSCWSAEKRKRAHFLFEATHTHREHDYNIQNVPTLLKITLDQAENRFNDQLKP